MKVIFLKSYKMGSNSFTKGKKAMIITSNAEELIEKGICVEDNSLTLRDEIVESVGNTQGQEVLDNLPDHAVDIVDAIPGISNIFALEHLATDDRSTVKKAAEKRLEELK